MDRSGALQNSFPSRTDSGEVRRGLFGQIFCCYLPAMLLFAIIRLGMIFTGFRFVDFGIIDDKLSDVLRDLHNFYLLHFG